MGIFHTKLVGVKHKAPDGIDRQKIIGKFCKEEMELELIPEPLNKYDSDAIGVWITVNGLISSKRYHIGYISTEISFRLSEEIQKGKEVYAYIKNVTGGLHGKSLGVNITIES
ncbi:HIRAN protein [Glaciecola sp. 4H-3-7+YE-5]|nr:HIRAN protein [Glaciecola sp. 4H-3-7+YE-5]